MSPVDTEVEARNKTPESEFESGKMSFLEHLDELRKRLVHIAAILAVGFVASFFFAKQIYDFLAVPMSLSLPAGTKLAFTKPTDPFTLYMKVAFLSSIM